MLPVREGGIIMKLTKPQREQVRLKYDGNCAYCGCNLPNNWHADHIEPIRRGTRWVASCIDDRSRIYEDFMEHPDRDCIENLAPACPSCNTNKHQMSVEQFRLHIKMFVKSLNNYSVQYKIAKRYGLVQENDIEVKFYFENYEQGSTTTE